MTDRIDNPDNVLYTGHLVEVRLSAVFRDWLDGLRDRRARLRIDDRIRRLAAGNPGDSKPIGGGVQELRLSYGPGYRVYYVWAGPVLVILLNGGDKSSQARDIARARLMAKEADDGIEALPL